MAYVHQFGIVDSIEDYKENEYDPKKYNCISVDGDFIDEIYFKGFGEKMKRLETFAHNINRPYKDLAYYGTTLIPPSSIDKFLNIIIEENSKYKSEEFDKLLNIIYKAIDEEKWIIHYGI